MQILDKYKKRTPLLVIDDSRIWDFILTLNEDKIKNETKVICEYIFNKKITPTQKIEWDYCVNNRITFKNIGFTGIDNGLIIFNRNNITNNFFLDLLKKSTLSYSNNQLNLIPVNSNTNTYDFSISFDNDCEFIKLTGGFLQAPFKISNDYQVLPDKLGNGLCFEFSLRPQNYDITNKTLNYLYPNNEGMFFYIGTRSENKFLNDYNYDFSKFKVRQNYPSICENENYYVDDITFTPDDYFSNKKFLSETCEQKEYFENGFIVDDEKIESENLILNNEVPVNMENYYEIKTDNKYLFFNNTKEGYNVDTWDENNEIILTATTKENVNMFLLLNNGKTGYTVDTIDEYYENREKNNVLEKITKDIANNALGFRIKNNGSIGYRYVTYKDECKKDYDVIEEYSLPNIVKYDEWSNIRIKIIPLNNVKMKIYIYINDYLKFISKELPILDLRKLDEINEKQEGVPFNISIGGGTMGLCDSITWNYNHPFKYVLPLEENFAGSFIGDIKTFKMYTENI